MKKKLTAIITCAIATTACLFTGCKNFTEEIINAVQYPNEYLSEYEIVTKENTVVSIAKGKDCEGNYYYDDGENSYLYLLDGENYAISVKTDGEWTATGEKVTEKYVDEKTEPFKAYAEKSREKFNGSFKETQKSSYLSRSCIDYELTINLWLFKQSYLLCIDETTGICLSFTGTATTFGSVTDKTGFKCLTFQTENVDFSAL